MRDGKIVREIKSIKAEAKSRRKRLKFTEKEIETSEGINLSEEQLDAINTVVNSPVSIITGGPGAGKTTMVQGLVSALKFLGLESGFQREGQQNYWRNPRSFGAKPIHNSHVLEEDGCR